MRDRERKHLSAMEREAVMNAWLTGRSPKEIAQELNCAARSIQVHYQRLNKLNPMIMGYMPRFANQALLSEEQKGMIYASWQVGRAVRKTAKEIGCGRRLVRAYYERFNKQQATSIVARKISTIQSPILASSIGGVPRPITLAHHVIEPEFQLVPQYLPEVTLGV